MSINDENALTDDLVEEDPKTEEMTDESADIESLKKRVQELQEEDEKLRKMHEEGDAGAEASKEDSDNRSIYVGNVDYSSTPEELQQHFHSCGTINRVTILCDKYTGHPKGFAYIEFAEKDSVANAVLLNESLFKGRQLKVNAKRTNIPGLSSTNRGGRGGGGGFGYGAPAWGPQFGGYGPMFGYPPPFPSPRGFRGGYRGRGFRGSRRPSYYSPY